ncbi:helix-turn-helix domain-containing protein [Sinomonas halotolerans]|uniref:Helix-turn-helix domain-containing protein n=1 Tax=Sinomonas halotolerans TaxID=1644133 RepID=A0ABU9WXW9_9MICC
MAKTTKRSYSFELKLAVVKGYLAGAGSAAALAREHGLSSGKLVEAWARAFRDGGEDALRPRPRGRPARAGGAAAGELTELERLRAENERLQAENAYLKKLRALRAHGRQ